MENKTIAGICPKCGHQEKQIVEGKYPEYNRFDDTVTKNYICGRCLTEWYEKFNLQYAGCEVVELTDNGYGLVSYDAAGNKE